MLSPDPLPVAEHVPLSAHLKRATRELHAQAERSGVMLELLKGRITPAAYLALMRNLRALYAALEAGLDQAGQRIALRGLWQPALRRLPALEQDLSQWAEPADPAGRDAGCPPSAEPGSGAHLAEPQAGALAVVPATQAYVARLHGLAARAPHLLPAHAYVRYLGDLYGGQVLSRLVRQQFQLEPGRGTAFYEFGPAEQVERLRADFRTALDAWPLTPAQQAEFIEEACEGFRLHRQMFEQIHAQPARCPPVH